MVVLKEERKYIFLQEREDDMLPSTDCSSVSEAMERESIFDELYESQRPITTSGFRHGHEQTKHQIQPSNSGNMNSVEWPKKRGNFFITGY